MDAKLFETLGKYAGLAGISIGLILVIYSALLKLNIFPKLKSEEAYALLRQMIYLTFIIGIAGIIAWVSINYKREASNAITGRVSDSETKQPLSDVEITIDGRTETSHTDSVGYFSLPIHSPLPTGPIRLYLSKKGYQTYNRYITLGENLDAEMVPAAPIAKNQGVQSLPPQTVISTETYTSDDVASGACKDFGAWATLCTPDKPQGWTIVQQNFQLTGDRAGCAWAECQLLGAPTNTKVCYRFRMQGHDEECGHSGNTGIHYSKGVLTVVWQHPA
ncbi:MAG: carboxypeptidase regulatory-like domain-containing protein [Candidatus Korobacteraceae bacterium]